jgi:RHS repeat-associated protein
VLAEERDAAGAVTKRFFPQGVKVETGPAAGSFFYTRDHLGSVRELTDDSGNVRARYSYDPWGRRTKLEGDLDADFGFAGMLFSSEAGISLARYRAYDAELGRWLSRDPLKQAERKQGPNLYAYVANEPINRIDPTGLSPDPFGVGPPLPCLTTVDCACLKRPKECALAGLGGAGASGAGIARSTGPRTTGVQCPRNLGPSEPAAAPKTVNTVVTETPLEPPNSRPNPFASTELEVPEIAETHVSEQMSLNEEFAQEWLKSELRVFEENVFNQSLTQEMIIEAKLGIIERHNLLEARNRLFELLRDLPDLW